MCSKSKGSYKTRRKISQTHQKAIWGSEQLTMQVLHSCNNIVLTASLGHFYSSSQDCSASMLLHASLDTGVCSSFLSLSRYKKKSREKGKKVLIQSGILVFLLYIAVAALITDSAAVVNQETKIVGWKIYLLKRRQMEKQPEKNELHSKRGTSAWKRSNTLKTEQL